MKMDDLVSLCRKRGFIFQSSEIYGGINGFWDYGPLGVELKKNIKDAWWRDMVRNPPLGPDGKEVAMLGVDCSIIMNPKVWEASGHVGGFQDPMSGCKHCKKLFRADQVWSILAEADWVKSVLDFLAKKKNKPSMNDWKSWSEGKGRTLAPHLALMRHFESVFVHVAALMTSEAFSLPAETSMRHLLSALATENQSQVGAIIPCPACGGELGDPRPFNLMFDTNVGAVRDSASQAYLRPETAQGIFVNFRNVLDSSRVKVPFGIAQIGKSFRNEITPRNYIFRSREFEQMEIEFFCHPSTSRMWYEWWRDVRIQWYSSLGIQSSQLRPREQGPEELAFYSCGTTDIEYLFPFSDEPQELEGVAHRGNYDLSQHMKFSGKDLSYFDEDAWESDRTTRGTNSFKEWVKQGATREAIEKYQYIPHVIEPSAGADRFTLAVLCEAFAEDQVGGEKRTVMRFHPRLAPIKAAILPLVNKDGMPEKAELLYQSLKKNFNVFFDDKGAVGRRYRRQDEIGTPFCITIDGQTIVDDTVTIRERDSTQQRRVPIATVESELRLLLS